MMQCVRAKRKASGLFFGDAEPIVVDGSKGGGARAGSHRRRRARQLTRELDAGVNKASSLRHWHPALDDGLDRGASLALLEGGFDPSVHAAIHDAVLCRGAFAPRDGAVTRLLCAKDAASHVRVGAVVAYRELRVAVDDDDEGRQAAVLEVLFLAVHPQAKRHGLGTYLVGCLQQTLKTMRADDPTLVGVLCVSLKSASCEAAAFWEAMGLSECLDDDACAVHRAVPPLMVRFDDFTPFAHVSAS